MYSDKSMWHYAITVFCSKSIVHGRHPQLQGKKYKEAKKVQRRFAEAGISPATGTASPI